MNCSSWWGHASFITFPNRVRESNLLKLFRYFLIILLSEQSWANSTKHNLLVKSEFRQLKIGYICIPNQIIYLFWVYCVQIIMVKCFWKHNKCQKPLLTPRICKKKKKHELKYIENFNKNCALLLWDSSMFVWGGKVYLFVTLVYSPIVIMPIRKTKYIELSYMKLSFTKWKS